MKKTRSLIALLLCAVMALSLTACGKNGGGNGEPGQPDATPTPEFVYASEYRPLDLGEFDYFNPVFNDETGFYGMTNVVVGQRELGEDETLEWEGQLNIYEERLYRLGFDGSLMRLEGYSPVVSEPAEGREGSSYTQAMTGYPGGGFLQLVDTYESWSDAPEGVEQYSEEWYQYYQYEESYYVRRLDADGREISLVKLDVQSVIDEFGYFYPYSMAVTEDGRLLTGGEGGVFAFDVETGEMAFRLEEDIRWTDRLITLPDGRIGAVYYGESGQRFSVIDTQTRRFGESIDVNGDLNNAVGGSGEYLLYYTNGINFCGLRASDGESVKVFNWLSCDVDNDQLNGYTVLADGTVIGLLGEWDETDGTNRYQLVTVSLHPSAELPQKQVLTLATQGLGWNQKRAIINFNRSSDNIRIEVRDYSEYTNYETDFDDEGNGEPGGLVKLRTEIMAGSMPDILDLSGLPGKQLAARGLLADLYPMLDADPELSREDFFPNVLAALENDGQLYSTASDFYIMTVIGSSRVVGDTPGWTYDELLAALDTMPEGCDIFDVFTTRDQILQYCLSLDMDRFVDWNTGRVDFDNREFADMLAFAARFPERFDYENYEWSEEDDSNKRIMSGRQMLMTAYLSSFDDVNYYQYIFGGEVDGYTFIGFPCDEGVGSMLNVQSGYAISASCADKDAAWQFVRQFMTEEYQNSNSYQFPTNIHSFEQVKKTAMTPEYQKDGNGNYVLDPETGERIEISRGGMGFGENDIVWFYALTEEQVAPIEELIASTTRIFDNNTAIFDIVREQSAAYFAGQKSAEEVARLVQSKANIYVNEQR